MSSIVRVLPPSVAERIAAGEVIERPSSVVKELVENSIDAGATEVLVLLKDGGRELIEIVDNGHGMPREDLALCVKRHATSKLSSLEDLESISTLGFRGEALPSIAAVSDLSILTRAEGTKDAFELRGPEMQAVTFGHFLNSEHGTRVRAQGLFSQVPARLKFLKSPAAEVSQVREWLERLALSHPKTGFKLLSEDRTLLNLRPQTELERVRAVLSDGEDFPIVTAETDAGSQLHARVHWLQGLSLPQMKRVAQAVNGRSVRDRLLQQAVLSPFRQALLPGQFPAIALFLEIPPSQIDVNVHPAKTEVRFLESSKVFRAIQSLVEAMIVKHGAPSFASANTNSNAQPQTFNFQRATSNFQHPTTYAPLPASGFLTAAEPATENPTASASASATETASGHSLDPNHFAGTLFNTYLLYDLGHELVLMDQHAAHERIRFEQLRKQRLSARDGKAIESQALLIPEAVHFAPESRHDLENRLGWLTEMGFEAELFGDSTVLFRALPPAWGKEDLRTRLKSLVERVLTQETQGQALSLDEHLFESLASEACHSAVRAGDRLERAEADALARELFACEHPWNCPHGRPTIARVPRARFEEWFLRRV
jgi:DNA mismatch repair protein MutL